MQTGGHAGAVFNAAKETALDGFLAGQITFTQMAELVDTVLNQATADPNFTHTPTSLEDVLQTDHMTRNRTWRAIKHKETET
jgi:1-deoxy-D-xylulose-5-phosphate reductoisomerase